MMERQDKEVLLPFIL